MEAKEFWELVAKGLGTKELRRKDFSKDVTYLHVVRKRDQFPDPRRMPLFKPYLSELNYYHAIMYGMRNDDVANARSSEDNTQIYKEAKEWLEKHDAEETRKYRERKRIERLIFMKNTV